MARVLIVIRGGRYRAAQVCRALGVSRSNVVQRQGRRSLQERRGRPPVNDPEVLERLRTLASQRPTYGYRRLWVMLNRQRRRERLPPVNAKRVYRMAKAHRLLLQRHTGSPPTRVHEGVVAVARSDQRYCSDGLEIGCTNGERVRVAFSLDCCDRQVIAFAATTAGISGELVRDVMVETMCKRFGEVGIAEPRGMAQRQRFRIHCQRNTGLCPGHWARAVPDSLSLSAKQRHGGVVRQNVQARLREHQSDARRLHGPRAVARLVCRLQRGSSA